MERRVYRGEYNIKDNEWGSPEMVFTALSMLESRGYKGLKELFAILDDTSLFIKIIRYLYGTKLELPGPQEFAKCLRAACYAFCDIHVGLSRRGNIATPVDIKNYMNMSEEEELEINKIYDEWIRYLHNNGIELEKIMHFNRSLTLLKITRAKEGKDTSKVYKRGNTHGLGKKVEKKETLTKAEKERIKKQRNAIKNRQLYNMRRRQKYRLGHNCNKTISTNK